METWLFLSEPARKARVSQVEGGAKASWGRSVRVGSERKASGQGQGMTEERTVQSCVVMLYSHLISQPFQKQDLYSRGPNPL